MDRARGPGWRHGGSRNAYARSLWAGHHGRRALRDAPVALISLTLAHPFSIHLFSGDVRGGRYKPSHTTNDGDADSAPSKEK